MIRLAPSLQNDYLDQWAERLDIQRWLAKARADAAEG